MGKYLKFFKDIETYNTFTESDNFLLPNVSYVEGYEEEVMFHPYVSLGPLPIKMICDNTSGAEYALTTPSLTLESVIVDGKSCKISKAEETTIEYLVRGEDIVPLTDEFAQCIVKSDVFFYGETIEGSVKFADADFVPDEGFKVLSVFTLAGIGLGYAFDASEFWDETTKSLDLKSAKAIVEFYEILLGFKLPYTIAFCNANADTVYDTIVTVKGIPYPLHPMEVTINKENIVITDTGIEYPNEYCLPSVLEKMELKLEEPNVSMSEVNGLIMNDTVEVKVDDFGSMGTMGNIDEENKTLYMNAHLINLAFAEDGMSQTPKCSYCFCKIDEDTGEVLEVYNTKMTFHVHDCFLLGDNSESVVELKFKDDEIDSTLSTSAKYAEFLINKRIPGNTFLHNKNLEEILLGENVVGISEDAFYGCTNLNKITFQSMTAPYTYSSSFYGNSGSGTIYIPEGATGYDELVSKCLNGWTIVTY